MVMVAGFASLFTDAVAQQPPIDWLIVPGERVGPITAGTSEAMLRSLFGPENVVPGNVYVGEGFSEPGAAVYPDDAMQYLEIIWQDNTRAAVRAVRLTGDSTRWHTAEGISLGSTLKEIEAQNGFPFRLFGFAWDYGGTVAGCGRGRLQLLGCTGDDGSRQTRSILLRLQPDVEARALPEYRQVLGEKEFSSGHPAMQALNPGVYQILVTFPAPE